MNIFLYITNIPLAGHIGICTGSSFDSGDCLR